MYSNKFSAHAEVSLDNLLWNVKQIRSVLPPHTDIIAVVKDNAYGCGSVPVSQALQNHGNIKFFAVARPEEAFTLRENGITGNILVLGRASDEEFEKCSAQNITLTLNDLDDIKVWSQCGHYVRFHCNIDTAMHRMGLLPCQIPELISALKTCSNLKLDGVFTHLAKADEPGTLSVDEQRSKLISCVHLLKENGFAPAQIHYGNSAGLMDFQMNTCTLVRPGIALYGGKPDPSRNFPLDLKPVLSLKGVIAKIKKVPAGTPISYGGNYITPRETYIATITIGYASGLPRFLSNRGTILINGRKYTIAGNVTMDYIMVDAGPEPLMSVGDEAVAIGVDGAHEITPDDIAVLGNTIGYEILCNISTSIDRRYFYQGSIVAVKKGDIF